MRAGGSVLHGGQTVARMSSGGFSPTLNASIGMAYLPVELAQEGTELEPLTTPSKEGLSAAEEFASRLAAEDGVEYMSVERLQELLARRQEETLYLLDIRDAGECAAGHLPGPVRITGGLAVPRA